jgi:hypothetical protein
MLLGCKMIVITEDCGCAGIEELEVSDAISG